MKLISFAESALNVLCIRKTVVYDKMTKNQERKAVVLPQITETMVSRCSSRISSDEECIKEEEDHHREQTKVGNNEEGHLKLPVLVWPKEEAIPRGRSTDSTESKLSLPNADHEETIKTNSEAFREELKALKEDLKQLGTYTSPPTSSLMQNNVPFSHEAYDGQKASEKYQEELKALKENMRLLVAECRDVILEARIRDEEAKKQANEEKKAARNAAKLADRIEPPSTNFSKTAKALITSKRLLKTDKVSKSESVLSNVRDKDKKDSDEESVPSSVNKKDIEQDGKDISAKTRLPNIGGNEVQGKPLNDVVNEVGRTVNNRNGVNNLRPISEETSDGTLSIEKTRNSAKSVKRKTSPSTDHNVKRDNKQDNRAREQSVTNEDKKSIKNVTSEESKDSKTDKNEKEKASPTVTNDAIQSKENNEEKANELNIDVKVVRSRENSFEVYVVRKDEAKKRVTDEKISTEIVSKETNNTEENIKVPGGQNTSTNTSLSTTNETGINMTAEQTRQEENGNTQENKCNQINGNNQINENKQVNGNSQITNDPHINGITSADVDFFQSQRFRRESNKETFDNRLSDLDSISSIADKTIGTSRRSSDTGLPGTRPVKDKKWYMNRYRVPKVPMEIALQLHKLGFEFESNRIRDLFIELQACESNLKKAIAQEKRDAIEEKKKIEREAREKERREAQRRRIEELEAQEAKRKQLEAIDREKRRLVAIERRKHNLELLKNINNTILQTKASRSFRFSYFPFLPKPKRHFLTPSPELSEDDSDDDSVSEITEDEEKEHTPVSRVSCHSSRPKAISRK